MVIPYFDDKSSVFSGSEFIGQRCWLAVIRHRCYVPFCDHVWTWTGWNSGRTKPRKKGNDMILSYPRSKIATDPNCSFMLISLFIKMPKRMRTGWVWNSGANCNHGWPSTQPGTCTQPCPIVHTAVPPLFTQPCPGRTMSTAVCIYVAGLCASCPAV